MSTAFPSFPASYLSSRGFTCLTYSDNTYQRQLRNEALRNGPFVVLSKSDLIYIREAIEKSGMNSVSLPVNIITGNVVGGREQVSLDYEEMIRREVRS